MPDWNDHDKTALLALLSRYVRLYDQRSADMAHRSELDARITSATADITKLSGAFSIFDVSTKGDGWGQVIRQAVGDDAYFDALKIGGRIVPEVAVQPIPSANENDDEAETEEQFELQQDEAIDGTVRELVLEQLKAVGAKGTTSTALREYIESARNTKLHYKTVGMTLYRLSKDGLVSRHGRTWFIAPPKGEAKNPGGETPGLIETGN